MSRAHTIKGRVGEHNALVLENEYVRAVILPELGGRVWTLEDLVRGRQWIWHREDVPLSAHAPGAVYDDVWAGGWEELFPNDAPGQFEGRDLPDHGEWWTMNWHPAIENDGGKAVVRLSAESTVIKAACVKEISLACDTSELSINYSIKSEEREPFHFLFKQHLALNITKDSRLRLPGGHVRAVDPSFSTILSDCGDSYEWPIAGNKDNPVDLSIISPSSSKDKEFLYVWNLPQAWCGIEDIGSNASIKMSYDSHRLPFVWLFLTYGGWRNLYTAVLEPCTNMPKDLSEAVHLKQSARLDPGQEFKTSVSVTLGGLEV